MEVELVGGVLDMRKKLEAAEAATGAAAGARDAVALEAAVKEVQALVKMVAAAKQKLDVLGGDGG